MHVLIPRKFGLFCECGEYFGVKETEPPYYFDSVELHRQHVLKANGLYEQTTDCFETFLWEGRRFEPLRRSHVVFEIEKAAPPGAATNQEDNGGR